MIVLFYNEALRIYLSSDHIIARYVPGRGLGLDFRGELMCTILETQWQQLLPDLSSGEYSTAAVHEPSVTHDKKLTTFLPKS